MAPPSGLAPEVTGCRSVRPGPRLRVDWSHVDLWLQVTPLEDVAAALLRLAGLAVAYWVLGSTALYLAARITGIPAAIGAVEWVTLPVVRRAADRAVAMVLAGSAIAGGAAPALAHDLPVWPPPVQHADDAPLGPDDLGIIPGPPTPAPAVPPAGAGIPPLQERRGSLPDEAGVAVAGQDDEAAEDTDLDPTDEPVTPTSDEEPAEARPYEVVAGDNLWVIAKRALADAWGRTPSDGEIAPYWRSLIEDNRPRLRSADPDLIYPGELLELPTVPTPEEADDA